MAQPNPLPQGPALEELLARRAAAVDARLQQARTETVGEITRTDSKAAALLAAFGLPLAVLVAALPGRDLSAGTAVLIGLGALGLVTAMLVVLLAVRPRLTRGARGSYLHWAACTPEQVRADLSVDRNAEQVVRLSQIAQAKYRALKVAIDITAGALVVLLLALAVALV
ncbi:Pycsar system effector family protein [Streptomyces sp. NPDC088915]|uniref:Pycsar system effector family protein n=1 Tax=Streptomyces sp. NPDC088915 TaxID=3365912 RepID=UPI00382C7463